MTRTYNDGATTLTKSETVTSGGNLLVDESIPDGSTNLQIAFAFTKAKLQSIYILASGVLTLKTNSTSSPGETIVLAANQPVQWSALDAVFIPNPFSTNVTTLYATNSSGAAVTLQIRGVVDLT